MHRYSTLCDDFYVNMSLATEMELPNNRETVLHYFERIQKTYPEMRNFYSRDRHDFVLEQDKEGGHYRWCSTETRRICSGHVNPESVEAAIEQHRLVVDLAPYALSVSPLDCDSLDLLFGFDFTYRGNHNQLVTEALGFSPALERFAELPDTRVINYEPSLTLALDENCRTQCRVAVENRTNAYHIRTGEFPEEQLSVYVSARQYGSLNPGESFVAAIDRLHGIVADLVEQFVIDSILQPLQRTISIK